MSHEVVTDGEKLVIKRLFAAPVEALYRAWTDPVQMVRWLKPNERWNAPLVDIDPVPGGRHRITMRHSDGDEFEIVGSYREIVPNERLSFTWIGKGIEEQPGVVTVEFRTVPEGTELTLTHARGGDPTPLEQTNKGWSGCLDTLNCYLASNAPIAIQQKN